MTLFENLQLMKESNNSVIYNICKQVRDELVNKYGEDDLQGKCIEASEKIKELLEQQGIHSKIIEGWCLYDDDSSCSDRCYDEHTWLELDDGTYIDVTADQFQYYIDEDIPEIIIGEKPRYMIYDEPEFNWLDEM